MNDSVEKREGLDRKVPPICAIGASAGGVTALQNLFRHLDSDLGLAYVVILHLPPDHRSMLDDILAGATRMAVHQVVDGPKLSPNCVYVIPPDCELVVEGDRVQTRPFQEPRGRRAPIDMFFRSVATSRGDGIGVILSGSGADGALGVRAMKEAGGVIMVQEPAEASFASMPQNAIATGVADFVAPLARLAELVAEVARSKEAVRSLEMDDSANDLRRIVAFLRARTGHDFSSYKRATVLRRVLRRMQVRRTETLAGYADILLTTPEESKELFSDLLISVTTFFRDSTAFEALERKAIRPIFDDLESEASDGVRAWVVGCATGEEAYSLAILFQEEALRRKVQPKLQIIASDLDEGSLATAREGRYPRSIEADVSEERLSQFFIDEGAHYRVRGEIRESVLFTAHNVIKDPPFRRLDLITCRNLLIYLERSLQQQLCSIFHYGLKPGSFLFLGSAETADAVTDLFAPLDRDARIYSARAQIGRAVPNLPSFALPQRVAIADYSPPRANRGTSSDMPVALHATALERAAPPSALVDDRQNIIHLSPSAGRFILHSAGPISNVLPNVVRPELRLDLRLALTRALDRREPTLTLPAAVAFETEKRRITLYVAPALNSENVGAQALVLFLDGGVVAPSAGEDIQESRPEETRRLHAELRAAQEALVESQSGHEEAIEDLRATNEELQSINEEFRSTAEELETSKEELQSINEELHTVNAELKSKLTSISVAHSDLQNLTAATEIGTLFLDANLHIKMFTPPIADLFNITQADIGRDFTDFTHRLEYAGIEADARRVLHDLAPIEREVASADGRWFVMRLRPYRTVEDRIDGAVATFVDITARLLAEAALIRSEQAFRALVNASAQVIYRMSPAWDEMRELVGGGFLSDTNRPDESWLEHYVHPEDHAKIRAVIQAAIDAKGVFDLEHRVRRIDGAWGWTHSRAIPILDDRGDIVEWFGSASDVTSRRRAEDALRESEARWRALIEGVPQFVWRAVDNGQWTWASPQWTEYTGLSQRDALARGWTGPVHPEDRENAIARWQEAERTGVYESEYRILRADENRYRWFQTRASPVRDEQSRIVEWLGTSTDVDDIRAMQGRQELMVAELQHRTRNLLAVVRSIAEQSMRGSDTMPQFWVTFERRVAALSRVQGLLSRSENEPITIGAVVRSELEAFAAADMSDRVVAEGPEVRLRKGSVQTLALALHELATNARKHGALANDVGRLRITWSTYADALGDRLSMEWRETGIDGTGVKDPAEEGTTGFGRLLIERALPHALHARTTYELGEKELRCTIDFPLAERSDGGDRE